MDKLRRLFTGSATSAIAALLMVGAIAFGSTVVRPWTFERHNDATTAQADGNAGHDGGATEPTEPTDAAEPDAPKDAGTAPATDTSAPDETTCQDEQGNAIACDAEEPPSEPPAEEPKDEPKDEPPSEPPAPAPSTHLTLGTGFNADLGKVVVEWSAYKGSFEKYKLVRSSDGTASWPLGDGDELVAVVGPDGDRRFLDKGAPCNTKVYYRAFAVRHTETGYQVLASSNVGAATRPCDAPPAEPSAMGLDVVQTADGVVLTWEACPSEAFHAYKVVRSATNPNPMYPLNDGTELIGVVGDAGTTQFVDTHVEPGQTWTYRVLSMGQNADGWYVLGLTDAKSVTVE